MLSALLSVFDDVIQLLSSENNTVDMVYTLILQKHLTRWIMVLILYSAGPF